MQRYELVVIGGGPAGLSAAATAAEKGVSCLLVDEQATVGGQIYRATGTIPEQRAAMLGPDYQVGRELVNGFNESGATHLPGTTLWDLNASGEIGILRDNKASLIHADHIIIATGAMERPVPFPGWTLPGVMTVGAGQILMKSSGLVPGKGVVLAGAGPLLFLLAWQYLQAGVTIHAILDMAPAANLWRALPRLPRALLARHYLFKGLHYQRQIKHADVPILKGVSDLCALGSESLEAITFKHKRTGQRIETPLLLTHFGVIPDSHMSRCAGCQHHWDPMQLCWRPVTDEWYNSSVDNISIIGDSAGIGGAVAARHAGRIAGFEAARILDYISIRQRDKAARKNRRRLRADLCIRPFLETFLRPPTALLGHQEDSTIICRCEEISAGEIRNAIREGHTDTNQIKFQTRCGMGPCQGRQCDNAVSQLLARERGTDVVAAGGYRIRPPIRPLSIGQLAGLDTEAEQT